jgi:hypothetical protein
MGISRNNHGNNRLIFGQATKRGDFMKKERQKNKEMQPSDNRLSMSTQHEDRFAPPQGKN